jgi:hypothetical protein
MGVTDKSIGKLINLQHLNCSNYIEIIGNLKSRISKLSRLYNQ